MAVKTLNQFEKNVSSSFGYVKKDLLMVNDAVSNLQDQIQHLSMNQAGLLGKIAELEQRLAQKQKKVSTKQKKLKSKKKALSFYDLKAKKKFKTANYKIVNKSGKKFAVAIAPSKIKAYRILGNSKNSSKARTPRKVVKETITY
jgi:predicted  nucleic acid-binding Zn-ribbon protein